MKYWIRALLGDAAIVALLVLGYEQPSDMALNAALFAGWFAAGLLVAVGLWGERALKDEDRSAEKWVVMGGRAWRVYDVCTDIATVLLFAAYGHFVLAAVMGFGKILVKSVTYKWLDAKDPA